VAHRHLTGGNQPHQIQKLRRSTPPSASFTSSNRRYLVVLSSHYQAGNSQAGSASLAVLLTRNDPPHNRPVPSPLATTIKMPPPVSIKNWAY